MSFVEDYRAEAYTVAEAAEAVSEARRSYSRAYLTGAEAYTVAQVAKAVSEARRSHLSAGLTRAAISQVIRQVIASSTAAQQLRFTEYADTVFPDQSHPGIVADNSVSSANIKPSQKLSNQELAIWMTIITCVFVYFSLAIARDHDSRIALIMATDGPSPFDAVASLWPFEFLVWMAYFGRSSGS
jgi:hypothetical protein